MDVSSDFPDRLYSTFLIKSADDDARTIEGIASTPSLDRQGDVMESAGAEFSLPHPLLWQHKHDSPVGHVIDARVTPAGIRIKAQFAKAGILPEIDRAWALVKAGLVRGLSVGWNPTEFKPLKGGRFHVKKWKWMETSTVTIGANQDATISLIKSLDAAYPAAPGTGPRIPSRTPPGASGIRKDRAMNISEQVTETKADLQIKSARLEELMGQDGTEGGLNDDETKELDALTDGVKSLTTKVVRLEALEAAMATQAKAIGFPAAGQMTPTGPRIHRAEAKELPKGTLFVRYTMAVAAGRGSLSDTLQYAKRWDAETPEVSRYIKAVAGTAAGGSPSWGSELVGDPVSREFVEMYLPKTIIGRLSIPRSPFNTRITIQTGGATIGWVGELGVKPVGEQLYTDVTLPFHKAAGIVVLSEELVRFGRPDAEAQVRRDMERQTIAFLDREFIDPAVSIGASNPASITNGVAAVPASGTDVDALTTDFNTAIDPFDDTDMGSDGLTLIMRPGTARRIGMLRDALGNLAYPGVGPNGGTLFGYTVITSNGVPTGVIVIVKNSEILLAIDDSVRLDASREATLDMGGGDTPNYNLWQRNAVGIRAEQFATWLKRRAEAVAVISGAAYGPAVGSP